MKLDEYYRKRAKEYEKIYYRDDPVRQKELKKIEEKMQEVLRGGDILEIACGTGYWTERLSKTAKSIVATDIVQEVVDMAKTKTYSYPVTFQIEDAYNLSFEDAKFSGGLANFWFSHIPKAKIGTFLTEFHRVLKPGSSLFLADNVYVEGVGGELMRKKGEKDTFKRRKLEDGSEHLVLKNYYTKDQLVSIFKTYMTNFSERNVFYGKCFWYVSYEI